MNNNSTIFDPSSPTSKKQAPSNMAVEKRQGEFVEKECDYQMKSQHSVRPRPQLIYESYYPLSSSYDRCRCYIWQQWIWFKLIAAVVQQIFNISYRQIQEEYWQNYLIQVTIPDGTIRKMIWLFECMIYLPRLHQETSIQFWTHWDKGHSAKSFDVEISKRTLRRQSK